MFLKKKTNLYKYVLTWKDHMIILKWNWAGKSNKEQKKKQEIQNRTEHNRYGTLLI